MTIRALSLRVARPKAIRIVPAAALCFWGVMLERAAIGQSVSDFELLAIESRRAIKSAVIDVETLTTTNQAGGGESIREDRRTIFLDGENLRNDRIVPYDEERAASHGRSYRSITCLAGNEHIFYSDEVTARNNEMALVIQPRDKAQLTSSNLLLDPRLFGMFPDSTLNLARKTLESVVGRTDRRSTRISDVTWEGAECKLVEYVSMSGSNVKLWICPEKGNSVLRIEVTSRAGGKEYESILDNVIELNAASGIWFPSRCHYRGMIDGQIWKDSVATITVRSINRALDGKIFSLAGMGVPAGKRITRKLQSSDLFGEYWDGRQIAIVTPGEELKIAVGWTWPRILLATISVLAAAGAAWFILQRTRRYAP